MHVLIAHIVKKPEVKTDDVELSLVEPPVFALEDDGTPSMFATEEDAKEEMENMIETQSIGKEVSWAILDLDTMEVVYQYIGVPL
jgi:hypothetical protein